MARRDSFLQSPFKPLKSPGSFYGNRNLEEAFLEDEDADQTLYRNHIRKYFEQPEDYTVGQIFAETDIPQQLSKKEPLHESSARNMAIEQPFSKTVDDSAYKSSACKSR